jgi:antitoxin FitA
MGMIESISLDSATLVALEERARRHGRSIEEEAADTLRAAVRRPSKAEMLARLDAVASMTPKNIEQTDSVLLLREDRDR